MLRRVNLAGLGLLLLLFCSGCSQPRPALDLSDTLARGSLGPVSSPFKTLAAREAQPYLGRGWSFPPVDEVFCQALAGVPAECSFYVRRPAPLTLYLEARHAGAATRARVSLNERPLQELELSDTWQVFQVELEPSQLRQGQNLVTVQADAFTHWRRIRALPRGHQLESSVAVETEGGTTRLGFGLSLHLAAPEVGKARLSFPEVTPWLAPGAPEIAPQNMVLRVGYRESAEAQEITREFRGPGPHRLELSLGDTAGELWVEASCAERPLPGQLGLQLSGPTLTPLSGAPTPALTEAVETPVSSTRVPAVATRPNIIVYLIDTLRADHLSCYGYQRQTSPAIDALAKDGVLFRDCSAQSSWTKTAVASIFLSQTPRRHRLLGVADCIPQDRTTLSELFQQAGYHTRAVFCNPLTSDLFAFEQGFDVHQNAWHVPALQADDATLEWLKNRDREEAPFFLYFHSIDPHAPYDPPPSYRKFVAESTPGFIETNLADTLVAARQVWMKGEQPGQVLDNTEALGLYDSEIFANDAALGELVHVLKQKNLYDDTVIVLVSDHGEEFFDHASVGHISSLYQELVQVPLIIKFPQQRLAGSESTDLWQQIDLAPTLLYEAGLATPTEMQGRAFQLGPDPGRPAFASLVVGEKARAFGQIMKHFEMDSVRIGKSVVLHTRKGDGRSPPLAFFYLDDDPAQQHNLMADRPIEMLRLEQKLRAYQEQQAPPPDQVSPQNLGEHIRDLPYLK